MDMHHKTRGESCSQAKAIRANGIRICGLVSDANEHGAPAHSRAGQPTKRSLNYGLGLALAWLDDADALAVSS